MDFHLEDLCGQAGPMITGPFALGQPHLPGIDEQSLLLLPCGNHGRDLSSNCPLLESEHRPVSTGRTSCVIPGASCFSGIVCDTPVHIRPMCITFMLSINRHSCVWHKTGWAHRWAPISVVF